jgi:hypothetical protein
MVLAATAVGDADGVDIAAQISRRAIPAAGDGTDQANGRTQREEGLGADGARRGVVDEQP